MVPSESSFQLFSPRVSKLTVNNSMKCLITSLSGSPSSKQSPNSNTPSSPSPRPYKKRIMVIKPPNKKSWICNKCGIINGNDTNQCYHCGNKRLTPQKKKKINKLNEQFDLNNNQKQQQQEGKKEGRKRNMNGYERKNNDCNGRNNYNERGFVYENEIYYDKNQEQYKKDQNLRKDIIMHNGRTLIA